MFYLLGALWGFHNALNLHSDPIGLVLSLVTSMVLTALCVVDSMVIRKPILATFRWVMFFTWPVSVPAYLVWSRRLRGLGLALLHAGLLCVVYLVGFFVSLFLAAIFRRPGP
jgi:uncharacterized membrane protein (UPF0136 family)